MACTYIIQSIHPGKRYTGSSRKDDANTRLTSHNAGKVRSTKAYRPWKIIYIENFKTYTEARKRELFFKSGQGRKYITERCQSGRMEQS